MKKKHFLSLLGVSLAMIALPAAAQTPDGLTPAVETMCDPLADATPGLQGLCVAMCEAQDCEATMDDQGNVSFSPSCNASAPKILANYDKLATPVDPPMPCVKVACPCWASDEIANIADIGATCMAYKEYGFAWLYGTGSQGGREQAIASKEPGSNGLTCVGQETSSGLDITRHNISSAAYSQCEDAVLKECARRGLLP